MTEPTKRVIAEADQLLETVRYTLINSRGLELEHKGNLIPAIERYLKVRVLLDYELMGRLRDERDNLTAAEVMS